MNRFTIILLLLLFLLGFLYFTQFVQKKSSTFNESEIQFAVKDTHSINLITLKGNLKGNVAGKVILEKKNGTWWVDGVYPAQPEQIIMLLKTIKSIEIREPVNAKAKENTLEMIKNRNVHVVINSENGDTKGYFVGPSTQDSKGTFMLLEGAENPYITQIVGFEGYLTSRFNANKNSWRDNIIFNCDSQNLKSFEVLYANNLKYTFELKNKSWFMNGKEQTDTTVLNRYLRFFGKVRAQGFIGEELPNEYSKLSKLKPDYRVKVTNLKYEITEFVLYERENNESSYLGWVIGQEELLVVQKNIMNNFFPFAVKKPM